MDSLWLDYNDQCKKNLKDKKFLIKMILLLKEIMKKLQNVLNKRDMIFQKGKAQEVLIKEMGLENHLQ